MMCDYIAFAFLASLGSALIGFGTRHMVTYGEEPGAAMFAWVCFGFGILVWHVALHFF
jgi:hypothetical protein